MAKDNSFYGGGGDEAEQPEGSDVSTENSESNDNSKTALLPKEFFGGKELNIGDECKVKAVHIYEDEVEVAYEDSKSDESSPSSAMREIDSMAAENQGGG